MVGCGGEKMIWEYYCIWVGIWERARNLLSRVDKSVIFAATYIFRNIFWISDFNPYIKYGKLSIVRKKLV